MNSQSRQSFLGAGHEEVLANSQVGIIGLCGGGSHIAQQLAHVGIGKFTIADFDVVETTNLTRMVGATFNDVGKMKTDIISSFIKTIKPDVSVTQINDKWLNGETEFQKCDVIFGCVDKYTERDNIERFCRFHAITYIDIGMGVHKEDNGFSISGQVIVSENNGPCMRCLGLLTEDNLGLEAAQYGEAGGTPQVIWSNGVLASLAVGQLMATLLPWSTSLERYAMVEYDGNRQVVSKSNRLHILSKVTCTHFPYKDS